MNNVKNLKRNFSFEYRYEVQGCIFTISQTMSGAWVMVGYASEKDEEECNYFEEWVDGKKKYHISFLKYVFERSLWAAS